MRLARAAQFSQPNRNTAERVFELLSCDEREGGGAIARLLKRILCVTASEATGEIVEKRQARARIYIFAEQVTARGIRMAA
jgi:hypothetical protein